MRKMVKNFFLFSAGAFGGFEKKILKMAERRHF